jgi:hypothetical protein
MTSVGLSAQRNEDLWVTARKGVTVVVAGPEQLKSDKFEKALRDEAFFDRCCGVGFDEVHLLNIWGPRFRKDFLQMGFVKARMTEKHNPWILTSATLRHGPPYDNIVELLGLTPGQFHVIRRSNIRHDVQILFREFSSSLTGGSFPELDWVLAEKRSTLIFPKTLTLASSIYIYLAGKCSPSERSTRVRMYNSMNFESHNAATREMMSKTDSTACPIVIGTDTLSVGIDPAAYEDALLVGEIEDADDYVQKAGRVGRHREFVKNPRVIVYVSRATRTAAEKALNERDNPKPTKSNQTPPDLSMAEIIVADCKVEAQNRLYNNPSVEPLCKCASCTADPPPRPRLRCNCSGCMPDIIPTIVKPPAPPKPNASIPKAKRLTKLQKVHGTQRLLQFQQEIWSQADIALTSFLPPEAFLPSDLIKQLLDIYAKLDSVAAITPYLKSNKYLDNHHGRLYDLLVQLKPEFVKIAVNRKAELAAARAAKKGIIVESDDESVSEDDEPDVELMDTKYFNLALIYSKFLYCYSVV